HVEAAAVRQSEVEERDVGGRLRRDAASLGDPGRVQDVEVLACEGSHEVPGEDGLVLDDEHGGHLRHSLQHPVLVARRSPQFRKPRSRVRRTPQNDGKPLRERTEPRRVGPRPRCVSRRTADAHRETPNLLYRFPSRSVRCAEIPSARHAARFESHRKLESWQACMRWHDELSTHPASGGFVMNTAFRSRPARLLRAAGPLVVAAALLGAAGPALAGLKALRRVPVPLPPNLGAFVVNRDAAIQLGKALFWETQAGGDGVQACASCHFHASADDRTVNTVNPGANGVFETVPAGGTLTAANFPITVNDVVGSQGVFKRNFIGLNLPSSVDSCGPILSSPFGNNRQVTGRNTPLSINAVFNFRNFWDGRANNVFNGVNPAGPTDPIARVLRVTNGVPAPVQIALPNASLASQEVGPPNNGVEMSCAGRSFPQLGRKLLALRPLGQQLVDPTDSELGSLSRFPSLGLNTTYAALIRVAFDPAWWNSSAVVNGFTVMENNFSLYWGLSVMLYGSTQVSDQTRYDAFLDGNTGALNAQERLGLSVF